MTLLHRALRGLAAALLFTGFSAGTLANPEAASPESTSAVTQGDGTATPVTEPHRLDIKLFHNGEIVTMEPAQPRAEAVVSREGKIAFVGKLADARTLYGQAQKVDLEGRTLMPGLIEQHLHPLLGALTLAVPVIAPEPWELPGKTWPAASGQQAYLAALAEQEKLLEDPRETLWSWGYHQYFHGELNREILDRISPTRPIGVWHRSCHEFFLNSAFINQLGITQAQVDAAGEEVRRQTDLARGHFYENGALLFLAPRIMPDLASPRRFTAGLKQMVEILHSNGVTAFNEPGAQIDQQSAGLYQAMLGAEDVPLYSFFIPESKKFYHDVGSEGVLQAVQDVKTMLPSSGKVRFLDKQVKLLVDGAIISQLMQMKDGYLDGHHGEWIQGPEETATVSKIFWDAGYQLHLHVNGDAGLEMVIGVLEKLMADNPRQDHRTTIVHFANSTDEQVRRLAALGAIVSANPYYVTGFSNKYAEIGLGEERAHAMVRLGPAEKLGMSLSLHSDLPMAPADPLYLAWTAVTRKTNEGNVVRPDLAISVDTALRAITIDAAYSWRMEDEIGSIREGKVANFTILEANPYQVKPEQLKDIEVWGTVFEGRIFPVQ